MGWTLPVGLDFADGVTNLPGQAGGVPSIVGTPLPTANLQLWNSGGQGTLQIEEPPGSPKLERAEQATGAHNLEMSWQQARYYWTLMPRGTVVNDTAANFWRILSCECTRTSATRGTLYYVMESISFDSPPDEFDVNEVSLDLDIVKHPRYNWALLPYVSDNSTYALIGDTNQKVYYTDLKNSIVAFLEQYRNAPQIPLGANVSSYIQDGIKTLLKANASGQGSIETTIINSNFDPTKAIAAAVYWNGNAATQPTANCRYFLVNAPFNLNNPSDPVSIAVAAATECISKIWRQEDTPYIAGYEVVWSQFFFAPIYLNPGGYIEDPRTVVPDYFLDPLTNQNIPRALQHFTGPVGGGYGNLSNDSPTGLGGSSIFDRLTVINPQCYSTTGISGGPLSMSCLRKSDRYSYDRTWFKVTHTWLCAPVGKWDRDIYTRGNRPQTALDYNLLPGSFGS